MEIRKICIVGPGAIGCLFASFLKRAGRDVFLLDKNPERASLLSRLGITIESSGGRRKVKVPVFASAKTVGSCDLVLIAVKAYDTDSAIRAALPLRKDGTLFLTLQNGLGNAEKIASVVGEENVLAGTTAQGANVVSPGCVVHAGIGDTFVGELSGKLSAKAKEVASVLSSCGIPAKASAAIKNLIWGKLIINAGINPLTAILRCRNGELLEVPETRQLLSLLVDEAVAVAHRKGVCLPFRNAAEKVEKVASLTGRNISSMLQDILKGRRTEVDYINGAVVREARKCRVSVPFNKMAFLLVKSLESEAARAKR